MSAIMRLVEQDKERRSERKDKSAIKVKFSAWKEVASKSMYRFASSWRSCLSCSYQKIKHDHVECLFIERYANPVIRNRDRLREQIHELINPDDVPKLIVTMKESLCSMKEELIDKYTNRIGIIADQHMKVYEWINERTPDWTKSCGERYFEANKLLGEFEKYVTKWESMTDDEKNASFMVSAIKKAAVLHKLQVTIVDNYDSFINRYKDTPGFIKAINESCDLLCDLFPLNPTFKTFWEYIDDRPDDQKRYSEGEYITFRAYNILHFTS